MRLKMTKQLNKVFETCSAKSLPAQTTALVEFAAQLASGREGGFNIPKLTREVGSIDKLHRVACLCACTGGAIIGERFMKAVSKERSEGGGQLSAKMFGECSTETLDKKTHHLVSLAACLASGCECASGHIVEARNAGATEEEIVRCACITACVAGIRVKYAFLAHLEETRGCRSCAC